jgi:hypothetical protein
MNSAPLVLWLCADDVRDLHAGVRRPGWALVFRGTSGVLLRRDVPCPLLGLSPRLVYNWEAGLSWPKSDQVLRWVELLDSEGDVVLGMLGLLPVEEVTPRQIRLRPSAARAEPGRVGRSPGPGPGCGLAVAAGDAEAVTGERAADRGREGVDP